MKPVLSASILSANFTCLEKDIRECESAGVDWIHIDVMDGHFVPNLTMGPFIVEAIHKITGLPLDCHLMVEKPEQMVESFARAGATYITIHPEDNPNVHRTLQRIKTLGCKPGLALNPGTPAMLIEPLLPFVDMILVMTVNPGFSGQQFIPEMKIKIDQIAKMISLQQRQIRLQVDGGITSETISLLKASGVDTFVSASSIFKTNKSILDNVRDLKNVL